MIFSYPDDTVPLSSEDEKCQDTSILDSANSDSIDLFIALIGYQVCCSCGSRDNELLFGIFCHGNIFYLGLRLGGGGNMVEMIGK